MVKLKDVAQELKCSPSTVSLILNNHPLAQRLNTETWTRVLETVERMGYVPNAHARILRQSNIRSIGIICSNINDPYCAEILNGILDNLNEQECFFKLFNIHNLEKDMDSFLRMVRGYGIEGIIIINCARSADQRLTAYLRAHAVPIVSIGCSSRHSGSAAILLDNVRGVRIGIEYLFELGHRDIVFILGPEDIEESKVRWRAIRECCKQLGIPCRPGQIERITDSLPTAENGAKAIRRLREHNTSFTAVFAFDDWTAYGVINELTNMGVAVPREVSVIGFDDIWPSRSYNPPLTTLRQPMGEMGWASAQIMLETLMRNGPASDLCEKDLIFYPKLVIRGSVAGPWPATHT
jgi:LacI family transcriptional regulator